MMVDRMLVEMIGGEIFAGTVQAKGAGRNEMQQAATFLAKTAIAIHHRADIAFKFIGNLAAMTAAPMRDHGRAFFMDVSGPRHAPHI